MKVGFFDGNRDEHTSQQHEAYWLKAKSKHITRKTKHSIGWSNRYHTIWLNLGITILYGEYRFRIWQAALQLCHMDTGPPYSWSWWAGRQKRIIPWWRHQMETFSAILALCEGNPLVIGGFPSQRTATRRFDVFCGLRMNKQLSKQSRRRWFEMPPCSLWRLCNALKHSIP